MLWSLKKKKFIRNYYKSGEEECTKYTEIISAEKV